MSLTLSIQTRRELLQQMIPRYRGASIARKGALLDEVATTTGYSRRYAMWLLNHAEAGQYMVGPRRQRCYGPEVQHALFQVWHVANGICSKRLMPFLPTLVEALERHGHLHLTEACRSQLLSMSAASADRLPHASRTRGLRGISMTRAGTLLKQRIPVRTFAQWNETRPGFVEADLVAHCGAQAAGSFLYTLTLTDIATGWTECLPLLSKSAEAVLFARLRKRAGITKKGISPSLLRESFARRYLQVGGEPQALQELLGYADQATSTRYQHLSAQLLAQQQYKEALGDSLPQYRPGLPDEQQDEDAAAGSFGKETLLTQPSPTGVIGVQNSRCDMASNQPGQVESPTKDHREREEVRLHRDVMGLVDP